MLFCVSLDTGIIKEYICQGIALNFSTGFNKSSGNPVLLQSNQHLSTLRPLNSIGVLVFYLKHDEKMLQGLGPFRYE